MIDIVILCILVFFGIIGLIRGFTQQVLSIAKWVGATYLAYYGYRFLSPYLLPYIKNELITNCSSAVLIFIFVFIILNFVVSNIGKTVKKSTLGVLDRSLGVLLGVIIGYSIVSIAYIPINLFYSKKVISGYASSVRFFPLVENGAEFFSFFILNKKPTFYRMNQYSQESLKIMVQNLSTLTPEVKQKKQKGYKKNQTASMDKLFQKYD